jgi:cytochrome c oxidase subunit 1
MSSIADTNVSNLPVEHGHDDHDHKPKGFMNRWLFTTNHKDIGTLYLVFSLLMFFIGGAMALIIRAELFVPGLQLVQPDFFNQMTTMHALIMVFGAVMPAWVGFANAFAMLLSTLFMDSGGPASGWTLYPPLSLQTGDSFAFVVFSIHMMGISSIMGSINVIATIMNMRAPGMTLLRMPLFVWTWLITAYLLIAVMPVLAGAVTMLLTDHFFATSFFNAAGGGDPVMFQHIFWFFGHPEVYIMILPAFGVVSEILPTFSRKPLFGYAAMVYATASIAFLSFIVWAHHMFTVGMPLEGELFFMYATMLIAVPTGVKVFNWVSTMWKGSMTFETPMLFSIGFVVLFTIGGLSGLMLAIAAADFQYHDTYFVVAHFHYVLVPGAVFALMAGTYYWLPKWTGRMYSEKWGKVHFWLSAIFVNVLFFPQHYLGLAGMPRRIPDYSPQFADFNMWSSIGGFLFGATQLIFAGVIIHCVFFSKTKAKARVWEGALGLEWTVPSPAPYHTFESPPDIDESMVVHADEISH